MQHHGGPNLDSAKSRSPVALTLGLDTATITKKEST